MATSHALKKLVVCLTFVLILRSFHPPDTGNAELGIYRTDANALTWANYEVLVPNSKNFSKTKMTEFLRTKPPRVLLKYTRLALIAELNISLGLFTGDIATNPG